MSAPPVQSELEDIEPVRLKCAQCGDGYNRHQVLHRHQEDYTEDEYGGWSHSQFSDLVQCLGCESVKLHIYQVQPDWRNGEGKTTNERLYPDEGATKKKRKPSIEGLRENDSDLIPADVHKMYAETLSAFESNCRTLAGVGLRAIVEAICIERGILQGTLEQKINELATKQLLAKPDADLLHEERYLGNAAVHEMATPSAEDLEDGLQIIEGLMNTIYILQPKAKRMKESRESKKKAKPKPKKK